MQSLKKHLSALILLFLLSQGTQAQFSKWVNKAKDKAMEKINGKKATDSTATKKDSTTATTAASGNTAATGNDAGSNSAATTRNAAATPPPPAHIDFPHTGTTVKGIRGTIAPVIDGDVAKISNTPQGKYAFDQARQKGLKGSDAEVFLQLIDPKNAQVMKEVSEALQEKYPEMKQGAASQGDANIASAFGPMSAPSLLFVVMAGTFDTWISGNYIKTIMNHDQQSFAAAFGVDAASLIDLNKHISYSIGNVFGINFTIADTLSNIYGTMGMAKKEFFSLPGVKIIPGPTGKFGDYNTVSEKVIVPVQPYTDKETGKQSDGLLFLHDIVGGIPMGSVKHYDPSYKMVFVYYFTHDLDKYLPGSVKGLKSGALGTEGLCVGASVEDEKGNSTVWKLSNVQTNVDIDQGEFQIPADYPIMTREQRHQAIRAKMGLK